MMAALYPAASKKRYGDELDALIEDAGGSWRVVFDLLKEAMKMQLNTWSSGKLALVFGISGLLAAAAVTSMSILLLIAWLGSVTLTFHVPADARTLFFAGGLDGICYASFIIGNGDLLHKPRLKLRIQ
ncbi:MAG TPA: hypothetical protein VGG97_10275 [Bryobacteraceae bacterium]